MHTEASTGSSEAPTSPPAGALARLAHLAAKSAGSARPGLVERRATRTVAHHPAPARAGERDPRGGVPRLQQVRTLESLGSSSPLRPRGQRPRPTGGSTSRARRTSRRGGSPLRAAADRSRRCRLRPARPARRFAAARARDPGGPHRVGLVEVVNYAFVAACRRTAGGSRTRLANRSRGAGHPAHVPGAAGPPHHSPHEPPARTPGRGGLRAGPRVLQAGGPRGRSGDSRSSCREHAPHHLVDEAPPVRSLRSEGVAELLFARLGERPGDRPGGPLPAFLHPGARSAGREGRPIGWAGALHPTSARRGS